MCLGNHFCIDLAVYFGLSSSERDVFQWIWPILPRGFVTEKINVTFVVPDSKTNVLILVARRNRLVSHVIFMPKGNKNSQKL